MNNCRLLIISILYTFLLLASTPSWSTTSQSCFSTAGFYQLPNTGREVASLNVAWRYHWGKMGDEVTKTDYNDSSWEVVSLPHGLEYLPVEASGCANLQGEAWYRKQFDLPASWLGRKLFVHFEGIMGKSKVWVNGQLMTEHFGGYTPVIVDITAVAQAGKNVITVWADNSDDPSYPVGKAQDLLDFSYFGGIYRDCWLISHAPVYITDANYENQVAGGGVFVSYDKVSKASAQVLVKTHLRNETKRREQLTVEYKLLTTDEQPVCSHTGQLSLSAGKAQHTTWRFTVEQPRLWSPEHPQLYYLDIRVKNRQGEVIDGYRKRIGIRSIEFKQKEGLWINGEPYGKIMGTNRHQDFAVLGNAMPNSLQWRDAKKLRDAGMKVIRTHYIIDPAFMDACDELGLFALVPAPGWQFWSDEPIFGQRVYSDIRQMIRLHRNHASLFFWEPILNETHYPASFAKQAAQICKEEYPYPYSISACDDAAKGDEYFDLLLRPTKNLKPEKTYFTREWGDNVDSWSNHNSDSRVGRGWGETPMLIQAAHYAKDYDKVYNQSSQVVGGCFWHSFDHQRGYHPDPFYGGMMDAFRQPKYSYYFFMAQREPDQRTFAAESGPMVYIAHEMSPFSPADVTLYSNCEEVRLTVYKDGKRYEWKRNGNEPIPSPIIQFKDVFDFMDCKRLFRAGKGKDCYMRAEGLIDGKVVAVHERRPAGRPHHLRLRIDDEGTGLVADGSDVVTVIAEMVDAGDNVKRLNNSYITFHVEGEARMLGEEVTGMNPQQLSWGSAAILIQSTLKPGKIRITAQMTDPGSQRPASTELELQSIPGTFLQLYDAEAWKSVGSKRAICRGTKGSLDEERARQAINQERLKEVEKQQTEFGVGIND